MPPLPFHMDPAPGELMMGSSLLAVGAAGGTVRCSAAQSQLMQASSVVGYYFLGATLKGPVFRKQ